MNDFVEKFRNCELKSHKNISKSISTFAAKFVSLNFENGFKFIIWHKIFLEPFQVLSKNIALDCHEMFSTHRLVFNTKYFMF
jgi:hypothetical protein